MPTVPKFDNGGVMPGPLGVHSLALVAGGETILPTHKGGSGGVAAVAGGGGVNVYVDAKGAIGLDPRALQRAVVDAIKQYKRTGGVV